MTALQRVAPFQVEVALWGYDVAGDASEVSAWASEERHPSWEHPRHMWDHDRAWLESITLAYEDRWARPPSSWALPYVTDQELTRDR